MIDEITKKDIFKELKKLESKGKEYFGEMFVDEDDWGFEVSIFDDFSYLKLENFVPTTFNLFRKDYFHMDYDRSNSYLTIWASFEDEIAIENIVIITRKLVDVAKKTYSYLRDTEFEIRNLV